MPKKQPKGARTFGEDLMKGEGSGAKYRKPRDPQADEENTAAGLSVFDPVVCEIAYRWYCPPKGRVLDPFAGGSVRGIVASKLGRKYTGYDLSEAQLAANREQANKICSDRNQPQYIAGDVRRAIQLEGNGFYDFLFTCPPYFDLEVYSDNPGDLSAMSWADFQTAYSQIIAKGADLLKDDRFAAIMIGDVRDKQGFLRDLPGVTIRACEAAGLRYYDDAIVITSAGSLPLRVGKQFQASRKLGRTYQRLQIFCKGSPQKATSAIGPVEVGEGIPAAAI